MPVTLIIRITLEEYVSNIGRPIKLAGDGKRLACPWEGLPPTATQADQYWLQLGRGDHLRGRNLRIAICPLDTEARDGAK